MARIRLTRSISIPDPVKISRYHKAPELGPAILFFSGGTALGELAKTLKHYTHNSIHLVTSFDSGGSSAELRKAFNMPAVGDLRNRLMALADESVLGHPEIYQLFNYRLSTTKSRAQLLAQLELMIAGTEPLVANIIEPMRLLIGEQLKHFLQAMPDSFQLGGASIGNLILTGGYLNNNRNLKQIGFLFAKLANVKGKVCAILDADLHLAARLADGSQVIGQHQLTGKEVDPIASPIAELALSTSRDSWSPAEVQLGEKNRYLIQQSELICYPPGSFYTSLIANLLPTGVATAIANNDCPKVFIPNLGTDPEQLGMTLLDSVEILLSYLKKELAEDCPNTKLINFVLIDSQQVQYPGGIPYQQLKALGIEVIDLNLAAETGSDTQVYDNEALVSALLSLT